MKTYEKPIAEIVEFQLENRIMGDIDIGEYDGISTEFGVDSEW